LGVLLICDLLNEAERNLDLLGKRGGKGGGGASKKKEKGRNGQDEVSQGRSWSAKARSSALGAVDWDER